jgi:hypothetical protein
MSCVHGTLEPQAWYTAVAQQILLSPLLVFSFFSTSSLETFLEPRGKDLVKRLKRADVPEK